MTEEGFIRKNMSLMIIALIIVSILAIIMIGYLVAPEIIYDQWIWKYYWGPIVADAQGVPVSHNGVLAQEGYTWVSELTYGVILIAALVGIYQLLHKLDIKVNWWFCLGLLPYILLGPIARVLEDSSYFNEPTVYWFISPLIYVVIAAAALLFLMIGYVSEKYWKEKRAESMLLFFGVVALIDLAYFAKWWLDIGMGQYAINPAVWVILSIFACLPFVYRFLVNKPLTVNTSVLSGGLLMFLPAVYLTARFLLDMGWGDTSGIRFDVLFVVSLIIAIIVTTIYVIAMVFGKENEKIAVYGHPLNLLLIVGHMVDGLTSWISIYDPFGFGGLNYAEKHPASNYLMEVWPPLFPIVKFILALLIIYVFDILYKEEMVQYRRLGNLLKIGIIILGLSPGLRDLLRVSMGV